MYRQRSHITAPKFGLVPGARPVRAIKPRIARSSIPGEFPSIKGTQPTLRCESLVELDGLALFEIDPDVVLMAAQPHFLRYLEPQPDGSTVWRSYCPDVALLKADGSVVIVDFKSAKGAASRRWKNKAALIEEAYRLDHRMTYLVITDEMVETEPRHSNAKILLLHAEIRADDEAKIAVLAHLERRGLPMSLGALRRDCRLDHPEPDVERAYSALMNLVIEGVVAIDLSNPIDDASLITWRREAVAEPGEAA